MVIHSWGCLPERPGRVRREHFGWGKDDNSIRDMELKYKQLKKKALKKVGLKNLFVESILCQEPKRGSVGFCTGPCNWKWPLWSHQGSQLVQFMQTKGPFTGTCPPSWLGQLDINQPARVSEPSGSSCSFSDVVETYWCLSSWFQIPQQRPLLSCKKLCIHTSIYMHDSLQIASFSLDL